MNNWTWFLAGVGILCIVLWGGCAPRGRPLRPTLGFTTDPPPQVKTADAWYIESIAAKGEKPVSCSFVEFDERGDYLDFQQHRHAYTKIKELATGGEQLLVFVYVHGWKNNSQSGDVVKFNAFLKELASKGFIREQGYRIHGVYLGWRGNAFKHALDEQGEFFVLTEQAYGAPIVNRKYARRVPLVYSLPEQLSYWSRKSAAEDKVSGIGIIRTMFTCAHTAKRYSGTNAPNRVFLMGHSFGALMLEQSFAPASLSRLIDEWPWDDETVMARAKANPLPFDLVIFVNSAAPSVYAKQLYGYMVAHRGALRRHNIPGADAPLVISLTSEADWATGKVHKWGNLFARFYPSLWRNYAGNDFILADQTNGAVTIPQSYYYRRTPGHNPLLVNHWIVPAGNASDSQDPLEDNLQMGKADMEARTFLTSARKKGQKAKAWKIITRPTDDDKWSTYKGHKPLFLGSNPVHSGYWIMRCQKEIISGHNDVWSPQAMESYAALFRETELLRSQRPARRP